MPLEYASEYASELDQQGKSQKAFKSCQYLASSRWGVMFSFSRSLIFFNLGFLSQTFTIHRTVREGEAISLTPLYHFHPLRRHLDISQLITAESSTLHMAGS